MMVLPTIQKAAWEGSPGTEKAPGDEVTPVQTDHPPAADRSMVISAPMASSISSVWGRVATGSWTTVSPWAAKPARRTADLTWALAIGGV